MKNWFAMRLLNVKGEEIVVNPDEKKKDEAPEVPDSIECQIYGEIGGDKGMAAKDFIGQIKAVGEGVKKVDLVMNCRGGDVFDGLAIYNYLKGCGKAVSCRIDGICASMGSVVAMAAKPITMPENAFMMVHNPVGGLVQGDSADMRTMAELLDKMSGMVANIYAERTGKSPEECKKLMDAETYMDGKQAKELGFCDEVSGAVEMAARIGGMTFTGKVPEAITSTLKIAADKVRADAEAKALADKTALDKAAAETLALDQRKFDDAVTLKVESLTKKPQTADEVRAQFKAMCDMFGEEKAGKYFKDGKTVEDAKADCIRELRAELGNVKKHELELQAKLAEATGSPRVRFSADSGAGKGAVGQLRVTEDVFESYCKKNGVSGKTKEALRAQMSGPVAAPEASASDED